MSWSWNKPLPRGEALEEEAEALGVTLHETVKGGVQGHSVLGEPELQRRVLAARAERRSSKLWMLAVASAVASIFSAIAAWVAALKN